MLGIPQNTCRNPSASATCCRFDPGSVMATKCFPASCAPIAELTCLKKYSLKILGSSVDPDLLETMNKVSFKSTAFSADRICAGSVESSTSSSGKPAILPKVVLSTSGHKLEPPIPSSRAFVKEPCLTASEMLRRLSL